MHDYFFSFLQQNGKKSDNTFSALQNMAYLIGSEFASMQIKMWKINHIKPK